MKTRISAPPARRGGTRTIVPPPRVHARVDPEDRPDDIAAGAENEDARIASGHDDGKKGPTDSTSRASRRRRRP